MSTRLYLYPVAIRVWHMVNALMFLLLIVTGLSLQYSSKDLEIVGFNLAITLHNIEGITLTASYLIFIIGGIVSGNMKHYKIKYKGFWNRLYKQGRFYIYGIFKHEDTPFPTSENMKFNPLQQFSYVLALFIGLPIVILTGWAYLFPEIVILKIFNLSGLLVNDLVHITIGFILSIFMFIHIYLCTIGPSVKNTFKSMITGWHE
ncbi:MAG: cytochrome b/b6 domain-containing protein [Bacteroidetes bacterium]|nr:cytochrome b/b6 domain-containing protein [Bacteroidota bacterium]